jgi:hypothetical protein
MKCIKGGMNDIAKHSRLNDFQKVSARYRWKCVITVDKVKRIATANGMLKKNIRNKLKIGADAHQIEIVCPGGKLSACDSAAQAARWD